MAMSRNPIRPCLVAGPGRLQVAAVFLSLCLACQLGARSSCCSGLCLPSNDHGSPMTDETLEMGCASSRDVSSSCFAGVIPPCAPKVKRFRFQETVEVFYFDRCPQFDRPAVNELMIPMGMRRRCFLHQQEALQTEEKDTRGKVRQITPEIIDGLLTPAANSTPANYKLQIKSPCTSRRKGWRTWFGSSSKRAFSKSIEELLREIGVGSSSLVSREQDDCDGE